MPPATCSRGRGRGRGRGRSGASGQPSDANPTPEPVPQADASPAQLLAMMQEMQNEIRNLRQGNATSSAIPTTATLAVAPTSAAPVTGGLVAPEMPVPVSAISLMQWMGMKLDTFDGSGTSVEAVDWLTYVEDKMEVFEVVYHDCVRFGTQLLKGEAQIWWKGVQAAHPATYGPLSWHDFVRQFERRFYPVTFLDKMKIDLHNYVQDKKTVAEYEVGFNKIVRFVPYVARNDVEKARQFRQGLKPSIRHMLGAFPLVDFRSTVEQALGIELQEMYTDEIRQSSSRDHLASKGQSSGPVHKKDNSHRHQPYRGNTE